MADENHSLKLDLSGVVDVRVRSVLRRLGVETIEKLLSLTEKDLSALKNCGSKTIAKIMKLQKDHSKGPLFVKLQRERINRAAESHREYMNKLIIVVIVAREVLEGATGQDRLYFRVTRQRINALRRALEALKKTAVMKTKQTLVHYCVGICFVLLIFEIMSLLILLGGVVKILAEKFHRYAVQMQDLVL